MPIKHKPPQPWGREKQLQAAAKCAERAAQLRRLSVTCPPKKSPRVIELAAWYERQERYHRHVAALFDTGRHTINKL